MAGILPGDVSHHGMVEGSPYRFSHDKLEEADCTGSTWYLSRREIEENSPSRRDGIDLKKEAYFRKSYCTFLQDLGMRLKVPQVTIATAIVFCHRFFLRQSLGKNDRRTIATVCMFLAGKVEETPRPLKDVILVSYEIIHKKDQTAIQRIKQREIYEQQKELILLGERVVLATLGFDLNVHHPYKPLVDAIKKFKVAQNALAQVAWNFVNDGLRTSLCLQFKPHHIAAGAIFLAAKFLKVKLPSDGEKVWWQEFDVTPRQLEEVSNQMLELYEQNRTAPPSHGNETDASSAGGVNHRGPLKAPAASEEPPPLHNGYTTAGASGIHHAPQPGLTTRPVPDQSHTDKQNGNRRNDQSGRDPRSGLADHKPDGGFKDRWIHEPGNVPEASGSRLTHLSEHPPEEPRIPSLDNISAHGEGPKDYSQLDAMKKIDKDKVKAALEKRRQSRGEVSRKMDSMDEDDLIERELESGIELGTEDQRISQERPLDLSEFHSPGPTGRKRKMSPGMEAHDAPQYHSGTTLKHRESLDAGRLRTFREGS